MGRFKDECSAHLLAFVAQVSSKITTLEENNRKAGIIQSEVKTLLASSFTDLQLEPQSKPALRLVTREVKTYDKPLDSYGSDFVYPS